MRQRSILVSLFCLVMAGLPFATISASAERLPEVSDTPSSIDSMSVGELGAVTDVFEPHHDVVDAEIASNAAGQRTLGYVERTDFGFDVKVATSSSMTGTWSNVEIIAQIPIGSNDPDIEVSLGANQVSTVIFTDANREIIWGSWRSASNPDWETPAILSTGLSTILYLDVGPLAASAFISFRGYDSAVGSSRAFAIDWYQTVATAPTVVDVSSTNTKQVAEVLQVTDGDDDAMIVWLQDAVASTTDTVWGNIWDGSAWLGRQQLSTSTGSTAVSTLAIGHAQNRMIVGWWEANTTIVADYFDPSADAWNSGTITLRSGISSAGVTKDLLILADPSVADGIILWSEKDGTTIRHRGLITGTSGPGSPFWVSNATDSVFNSSAVMRDNGMVGAMESDGDATVMWRYIGYGTTTIRFTRTGTGTGTWGAEATYGGTAGYKVDGHGTFGATGGATSQTMWVLAGRSSVKALGTSTWSGTSPTAPTFLTDDSTFDSGSNLVLGITPTGNALALWADSTGDQLFYSTKSASASVWSAPTVLVDTYWFGNPRLVDDGSGNFALLWRERSSSVSTVVARVATWNQSSGWSTPTTISSASVDADCLSPAMTSAGSGLVTYVDTADQNTLYGATFDTEGNATSGTVIATDSSGVFTCGGDPDKYSLALVDDGRYMVAFDASNGFGSQIYTVDGSLGSIGVASPMLRSPAATSGREYYFPKLASKSDGTVALVWNGYDVSSSTDSQTVVIGRIGSSFGAPIDFDASTGSSTVDRMDAAYLADGSLVFTALQNGAQYDISSMRLMSGSTTPSVALLAANVDQYYVAAHDSSSYNVLALDYSDRSIDYHRLDSGDSVWTTTDVTTPTATLLNSFAIAVSGPSDAIGWVLDNSSTTWPQVATRSPSGLITLSPTRIINTRPTGKIGNRTGTADPMIFNVYGKGGLPGSGIDAVLLNVTVVDPEVGNEGGFLTVYPCALGRPEASNLNFVTRQIIPNTVIAPVDGDGNICIYSYGQSHVLADVSGYFPSGSSLRTLTPSRVINTRPTGKIGNRTGTADPMIFNVYGQGGLPSSGIGAVLLNVTVVDPEVGNEGGFLTVYPCALGRPEASNLNFVTGQIIPNTVIAPVDSSGNICFYSYGRTHVLADVSGYFPTGSALQTLTPSRVINTRPTGKIGNRTGTADPMIFNVYGQGGLPSSGIGAVLLNVTVVDPEVGNEGGFLTVYPCALGRPEASNLNFVTGQIIPNTVIAPVDSSGNICFYSYGRTHVLADVSGYFPR